ncbi:hypothetical protein N7463_001367 [Penicillium fimorum]|uniref:Oleate hydratase n=1 Tax=Penicillium fimorum TaxID=1882269 RepID=A0A9W9Y605_9EURO|nr:hypothetical protein N7463_001367 [Penicillium fimorum]
MAPTRDPKDVQTWLIGSGGASLAAAVHLINRGKVPARQVHIFDAHHRPGGAMKTSVGGKLSMDLIVFILEGERRFDSKKICDVFEGTFFASEFWALWSTRFKLQMWHSATEFHRLLVKYHPDMNVHNNVPDLDKTPLTLYESLIIPVTTYLKHEGVEFRFHSVVTELGLCPTSDQTTISKIIILENEKEIVITVDPIDIVIVTLGSFSAGTQTGSNARPPEPSSISSDIFNHSEWGLWQKLAHKCPKFGNPRTFLTRLDESAIETFTITLHDSDFMRCYTGLTRDNPGTGSPLTVLETPWGLNISVPHQPVFTTQPKSVNVIWGYGLYPERNGKYVQKPMEICSGEEIFELLSHLGFPINSLLPSSITIPCVMPLGTSMLLSRTISDRPPVVPFKTTNLALHRPIC